MNEPKIMAIDDDIEMLKQLAIMLKDQYAVSVMTGADQALAALSEGNYPDLILLDVMMPDTDGFSLMEHLKNDQELKNIPVIFLLRKGFRISARSENRMYFSTIFH